MKSNFQQILGINFFSSELLNMKTELECQKKKLEIKAETDTCLG